MIPALTDFVALIGVALVVCAVCLRLPLLGSVANEHDDAAVKSKTKARWLAAVCFAVMWIPVGAPQIPVAAYIRGLTSDFSLSLVILAALALFDRLSGLQLFERRERQAVFYAVAAASLFLYPLALGWSDWDAYRLGWGSAGLYAGLLLLCLAGWVSGLRLLPVLIGMAMLAWAARLMESTNLWDYLIDPWLAVVSIIKSVAACATQLRHRISRQRMDGRAVLKP